MTYYEILKESKIVYEYLIDILDNSDIQLLDNNQGKIKEFLTVISDIYENAYSQTKEYNKLLISDLIDYTYLCDNCDENYYYIEVENNNKWYLTNDNNENLNKSFNIGLSYNKDTKKLYIGTEDSSGAKYVCNDIDDIKEAVSDYIFEYINYDTFSIKIWETEEYRDAKESIVLDGTYYDLKDAVARLKKVMSRQNYAFAEIENEYGELFYSTDGVNEEYHKEQNLEI